MQQSSRFGKGIRHGALPFRVRRHSSPASTLPKWLFAVIQYSLAFFPVFLFFRHEYMSPSGP